MTKRAEVCLLADMYSLYFHPVMFCDSSFAFPEELMFLLLFVGLSARLYRLVAEHIRGVDDVICLR